MGMVITFKAIEGLNAEQISSFAKASAYSEIRLDIGQKIKYKNMDGSVFVLYSEKIGARVIIGGNTIMFDEDVVKSKIIFNVEDVGG